MGTTWGPHGCGDYVGTTSRQYGNNMGTMGMWRLRGNIVETTWGQHKDNVETTWGPLGCGDHMGTTWRQHGDPGDVETTWGQHGDNMRTMWGPLGCGDDMGTT